MRRRKNDGGHDANVCYNNVVIPGRCNKQRHSGARLFGANPEARGRYATSGFRVRPQGRPPRNDEEKEIRMRKFLTVLAALATLSLTNCGYNAIQSQDEQVKSSWSEVVNQYQRRADLIPNLVNSVKGFAQQEKDVLLGVTNARAKVGSV